MSGEVFDWIKHVTLDKIPQIPVNKVDTHHHFVPDFYAHAVEQAGGDPSGWATPQWSPEASEAIMRQLGAKTAILSLTAPGACILTGQQSYDLARKCNEYCAALRDKKPSRWGFFAALPSLLDTQAALEEFRYAFDVLKADGVTLFTRYGEGNTYLGHADVEPIWKELDSRKAVVFVHPTHPVDTNKVNPKMMQPMIDYTHETSRTATDMILQGTRRKYPNCKVILPHAGGGLPYIIGRITGLLMDAPGLGTKMDSEITYEQAMNDFRSFYYDLALSTSPAVLRLLFESIPHDHILYGSDFPYAPPPAYKHNLQSLEELFIDPDLRASINYKNALALIPRLAESWKE